LLSGAEPSLNLEPDVEGGIEGQEVLSCLVGVKPHVSVVVGGEPEVSDVGIHIEEKFVFDCGYSIIS